MKRKRERRKEGRYQRESLRENPGKTREVPSANKSPLGDSSENIKKM